MASLERRVTSVDGSLNTRSPIYLDRIGKQETLRLVCFQTPFVSDPYHFRCCFLKRRFHLLF